MIAQTIAFNLQFKYSLLLQRAPIVFVSSLNVFVRTRGDILRDLKSTRQLWRNHKQCLAVNINTDKTHNGCWSYNEIKQCWPTAISDLDGVAVGVRW